MAVKFDNYFMIGILGDEPIMIDVYRGREAASPKVADFLLFIHALNAGEW